MVISRLLWTCPTSNWPQVRSYWWTNWRRMHTMCGPRTASNRDGPTAFSRYIFSWTVKQTFILVKKNKKGTHTNKGEACVFFFFLLFPAFPPVFFMCAVCPSCFINSPLIQSIPYKCKCQMVCWAWHFSAIRHYSICSKMFCSKGQQERTMQNAPISPRLLDKEVLKPNTGLLLPLFVWLFVEFGYCCHEIGYNTLFWNHRFSTALQIFSHNVMQNVLLLWKHVFQGKMMLILSNHLGFFFVFFKIWV